MTPKFLAMVILTLVLLSIPQKVSAENWILYNSGRFDILQNLSLKAVTHDGSKNSKILDGAYMNPRFTRDGQTVFMSVPEWRDRLLFMMIYKFSLAGLFNPYRITPLMGFDGDPRNTTMVLWAGGTTISPDQSKIIYQASLIKAEESNQNFNKVSFPNFLNPVKPKAMDPRSFLAIAKTDGSNANQPLAIELPGQETGYAWTQADWHPSDPSRIAVTFLNSFPGYQDFTIYITNLQGNPIRSLLNPVTNPWVIERHRSPAWSPDGNSIAYVRQVGDNYAVYIVRADGSDAPGKQITPVNIVKLPAIPDIGAVFPDAIKEVRWSPNGQYLVFNVYTHPAMQSPMGYDLFTVRQDGTELRQLTEDGMNAYPEWYPLPDLPNNFSVAVGNDKTPTAIPEVKTPTPGLPTNTPIIPSNTPVLPTNTHVVPSNTPVQIVPTPAEPAVPAEKIQFNFDLQTMEENGWNTIPGGFVPETKSGSVRTVELSGNMIPSSQDKRGIAVTVDNGQVAFFYTKNPINTGGKPILLRMTLRADSADASIVLGVLKGPIQQVDGSIATQMPITSSRYVNEEGNIVLLYEPDEGELATPIIQVASTSKQKTVNVYIDRLEITVLNYDGSYIPGLFQ